MAGPALARFVTALFEPAATPALSPAAVLRAVVLDGGAFRARDAFAAAVAVVAVVAEARLVPAGRARFFFKASTCFGESDLFETPDFPLGARRPGRVAETCGSGALEDAFARLDDAFLWVGMDNLRLRMISEEERGQRPETGEGNIRHRPPVVKDEGPA